MSIPKENKMMVLFLSEENKLWRMIRPGKDKVTQAVMLTLVGGLSPTSLSSWKRGGTIGPESEEKIFSNVERNVENISNASIKSAATELVSRFSTAYKNKSEHVYNVAQILGIDLERGQKIVDEAIYSHLPLLTKCYMARTESRYNLAEVKFEAFKGVYAFNMRRNRTWLSCALRIRYVIKIADGLAVRCKLNVPKVKFEKNSISYWEYDGFVSFYDSHVFWVFEKRDFHKVDYITVITLSDKICDGRLGFVGTYLTTGQDEFQSIVSDDVYLERILASNIEKQEEFMHTEPKVLYNDDAERVSEDWELFKNAS